MACDNLGKLLAGKYPERFAAWILGEVPGTICVLKTELSIEPIRADSLLFLQMCDLGGTRRERILHLEFQTR
ncbi:hypothetical protein [Trichothermofontia sp.]